MIVRYVAETGLSYECFETRMIDKQRGDLRETMKCAIENDCDGVGIEEDTAQFRVGREYSGGQHRQGVVAQIAGKMR